MSAIHTGATTEPTADAPAPERPSPAARRGWLAGCWQVVRLEVHKLAAQLHVVVLAWACVLAPVALVAVLRVQSSTPADTLFGRWIQTTGFATPLVVLGFAGQWAFPALASVVAGDMFAGEDRHATWKALLSRSRRRSEVFVAKVAVALSFAVAASTLLVLSSLVAGVVLIGTDPVPDLSGSLVPAGEATRLVLLSGLTQLPPVLAMAALALLLSVTTRNALVAVSGPVILALVLQLVSLADLPPLLRALSPSGAFASWHGLWLDRWWTDPLWIGTGSMVGFTVVSLAVAAAVFIRRDLVVR